MDSKHTPAPWSDGRPVRLVAPYEFGLSVSFLSTNDDLMQEEGRANARLITSAPELLEALKYARRFLKPEDHDTDYVDGVIAKASGQYRP